MDKKVISITLWGNGAEKGKWIEWYDDIKEIMNSLGYKQTHIGITSKSYTSGKILTVARKEKEILAKIKDGEIPSSFSCYSLPKGYRQAVFDYEFYCEREEKDVSVIMNEVDYNPDNEQMIISVLKKYIDSEYGEIYSALRSDAPWIYAGTRKVNDLKSYELIRRI